MARKPRQRLQFVPPQDLPLDPGKPVVSDRQRQLMIDHLVEQGCDKPSLLTAWLVRREVQYYDGPGSAWDFVLLTYAAARDAACWQLGKTEKDVLAFLESRSDKALVEELV